MEFKLNKDQRNVANGAANDGSRPVLEAVHFRNGLAEVADGYILVQKYIDYTGPDILVNAKQLSAVKDAKCISGAMFIDDESNGHIEVNMVDSKLTLQKTIGTFPNADQLYPTEEPVFKIALGKSVLQKVLKTMNKDSEIINFYFTSESKPVGFKVVNDCQGLIMPMHVDFDKNPKLEPYKAEKPEPEPIADNEIEENEINENDSEDTFNDLESPENTDNTGLVSELQSIRQDHQDNENMQQYVNDCIAEAESLTSTPAIAAPVAV